MSAVKDNDSLSEIRHEYRVKKKQLEKYDSFIDQYWIIVVFTPLLFSLINLLIAASIAHGAATGSSDSIVANLMGISSLVLLLAGIVMAFITGIRKSAKNKIKKQLVVLKDEVVIFQRHTKDHSDITRDELGLWRDVDIIKSRHKRGGVPTIVTVMAILACPFVVGYFINRHDSNNQEVEQLQTSQSQCLDDAYSTYTEAWNVADKDGDGNLDYSDGSSNITTNYYDEAISCYRTYKTDDSENYISDYQTKRQQEVDKYTAWLEASKQPTYVPTYNNSSMSCTSNSIGSSTYTNCY